MQAPRLAQPEKWASLRRDWAIWTDGCIGGCSRSSLRVLTRLPSVQIARSRTRDLIRASLGDS